MAYSTPLTAVSSSTLTAAQWNASVRDNILETPAAKATAAGRSFWTTGVNAIAEREVRSALLSTSQTTTSTSYTNLATTGPQVASITTGTMALAIVTCLMSNNTASAFACMGVAVSGATTIAAADDYAAMWQSASGATGGVRSSSVVPFSTATSNALTAGANTFTAQYRVSAGTGTFSGRMLTVFAM